MILVVKINISKLSESEFDAHDKYGFPRIGKSVLNTIKEYGTQSKTESFVLLHGAIELIMFNVWAMFLMKTLRTEFRPLENFLDFKTTLILLEQANLIDKTTKSKLCAFKKGRDFLCHQMTNKYKKKKISDKNLDDYFKQGIDGYRNVIKTRKKIIDEIKKITL